MKFHDMQNRLFGDVEIQGLEHRCYNGICLFAGLGCVLASLFNTLIGIDWRVTLITFAADAMNRRLSENLDALQLTNRVLEKALVDVKTVSGLLPICASCQKIRNDRGYWDRIETYIQDHSNATFSHSLCPDCARKLYPDFFTGDTPLEFEFPTTEE